MSARATGAGIFSFNSLCECCRLGSTRQGPGTLVVWAWHGEPTGRMPAWARERGGARVRLGELPPALTL